MDVPIEVMIPRATVPMGEVSPERAAILTADVANIAVPAVAHSRVDWTGISALFCTNLTVEMTKDFKQGYGARVSRWNK